MQIHFTDAKLKALACPAKGKLSKYLDTECPGLMLKVNPTNKKYFYIRKKVDGKTREVKIGEFGRSDKGLMNSRAARRDYWELINAMEKGLSKIVAERRRDKQNDNLAITELIQMYLDRYTKARVKPQTFEQYTHTIVKFNQTTLPQIPVKFIERSHCIAAFETLLELGYTKQVLKSTFCLASRAFQWAIDEQLIPESYDCFKFITTRRIATLPTELRKNCLLTDDELRGCWFFEGYRGTVNDKESALRKTKADPIKQLEGSAILRLLIMTGLRTSEIRLSKWSNWENSVVVQDNGIRQKMPCLILSQTKTGRSYFVPLLPPVQELLAQYKKMRGETGSPYVFPTLATTDSNSLRSAVQKINKVTHTLHDIRRTVATRLGNIGYNDDEIARILNHARRGVTAEHYNHSTYLVPKYKIYQEWIEELQRVLYSENAETVALPEFSLDAIPVENPLLSLTA